MKRSLVIIPILLLGVVYFFSGCDKEISGDSRYNSDPEVFFVNIPEQGARFSSDTTIYWYGTDIDGFITSYRYAVIRSEEVGSDPEAFLSSDRKSLILNDSLANWVDITVNVTNTGTSDRVQMSADISDPVRMYVASYIFLQATDNLGAKSIIEYRWFQKNNHFPNTYLSVRDVGDPYINALNPEGLLEGVEMSWSGDDPIDYPRNPPPFQFRWKIFGPYSDSVISVIDSAYVDLVFVDNYGDLYLPGDTIYIFSTLDTTFDADTVVSIDSVYNEVAVDDQQLGNPYGRWQNVLLGVDSHLDSLAVHPDSLSRLDDLVILNSTLIDSSLDWTYDLSANVYDLFRDEVIPAGGDTTRQLNFITWCQARDDADVPDIIPAFDYISAIEPKFERDVLVLDMTRYRAASHYNFAVFPQRPIRDTIFGVKTYYSKFINTWKPGSFDADNILPDALIEDQNVNYSRRGTTQDYYPVRVLSGEGVSKIPLREILKHKQILFIKDDAADGIPLESIDGLAALEGINAGINAWIMGRAAAGIGDQDPRTGKYYPFISEPLRGYFGVDGLVQEGWTDSLSIYPDGTLEYPRLEDFIGALPLLPDEFPALVIDTALLEANYLWDESVDYPFRWEDTGEMIRGALPEVGYVQRGYGTEPLYLYNTIWNRDGISPPYYITERQGAVVAIRKETPFFRTAHFCFTFMATDQDVSQQVFNRMMDWLSYQPFIGTGKLSSSAGVSNAEKEKYRSIVRQLRSLKEQGLLPSASEID